jgi:hypothetical protein
LFEKGHSLYYGTKRKADATKKTTEKKKKPFTKAKYVNDGVPPKFKVDNKTKASKKLGKKSKKKKLMVHNR